MHPLARLADENGRGERHAALAGGAKGGAHLDKPPSRVSDKATRTEAAQPRQQRLGACIWERTHQLVERGVLVGVGEHDAVVLGAHVALHALAVGRAAVVNVLACSGPRRHNKMETVGMRESVDLARQPGTATKEAGKRNRPQARQPARRKGSQRQEKRRPKAATPTHAPGAPAWSEPTNEMALMSGWSQIKLTESTLPWIMLRTPGGRPACQGSQG